MSLYYECYRYATPGTRNLKRLQAGSRWQQARYLPGLEIRADSMQPRLLAITVGRSRIYRQGSLNVTHFNLSDRKDSICGAVDKSGKLISRESWYPFGGTACWLTAAQVGSAIKFQRFAGKERDVTGLIFYGWRYYAPWQMRWLSSDPAGTVDGLNVFLMVRNNPATLCDRDGRMGFADGAESDWPLDMSMKNQSQAPSQNEPLDLSISSQRGGKNALEQMSVDPIPEHQAEIPQASSSAVTADASIPGPSSGSHKPAKSFVSPESQKSFPSSCIRKKSHNKDHGISYDCEVDGCGKSFNLKSGLMQHTETHAQGKKYICQVDGCNKIFNFSSGLSRHKNVHKDRNVYACGECGSTHINKNSLQQHVTVYHKNKKSFPCDQCGYILTTKNNLNQHIQRHHT